MHYALPLRNTQQLSDHDLARVLRFGLQDAHEECALRFQAHLRHIHLVHEHQGQRHHRLEYAPQQLLYQFRRFGIWR